MYLSSSIKGSVIILIFALQESMIDVTLACDGKLLQAHKFVLSMCSDYFKEMFTSNPCKHPIGVLCLNN